GTVLQPFTVQQEDPFGTKPLPTPSSCGAFPANQPSDVITVDNPTGTRCFNSTMDIKGDVTLASGTYILNGVDFTQTNSNAKLTCLECTFVLMNDSGGSVGTVNLNGGKVTLSSPTSGTYKGMLFYQSRTAAADNNVTINGNASSSIEGALYFPKADLTFNGTAGMTTACMQIVAKDVTFTGNSSINNTCPSGGGSHSFDGKKVRLVA
ncbi:MAG: hypothetical protein ACJ8FG_03640, partial [Sphingomicrobium sp.]